MTKVSSSVSTTGYTSFDILGRVTGHKQTTDGQSYSTTYGYNLSGALVEQTYPSGRVVKNVLDNNGDLNMVQSKKNANFGFHNYAENFTYNPAGAVTSMQLGNGRWESTQFNSRLQPTQIALGQTQNATNLLKLNYSYGSTDNNGNILSQTITVPTVELNTGFVAVQNYTYDSLNRIKAATENVTPTGGSSSQSWKQAFTYDRYGNRNFDEANTNFAGFEKLCNGNTELCASLRKKLNPEVLASNNRIKGDQDGDKVNDYVFDAAGNTVRDPDSRKFTYDAENKQIKVETVDSGGTPIATIGEYFYDGDGKRIKKYVPNTGETTIFVYDASGKTVAEYSTIQSQTQQVSYTTADHLGSPRVITDESGQVTSRRDFHPFGEEIMGSGGRTQGLNYTADDVRQKFTSYERDEETDLDFAKARMHNYNHGRFNSPDPILTSGRPFVPQTWNRYVYALNSPLVYIDPTGFWEWSEALGGTATDKELEKQRDKAKKEKNDVEHQRLDGILTKRKAFIDGLAKAKNEAKKIKDKNERATVKATLAMYGKPQDGNNVTIAERDPSSTSGAAFTKFENGRYIVAFSASEFSANTLYITIAHESFHVGNLFFDRFLKAMGATGYTTTVHDTERMAYRFSSLIAQASGVTTLTLNSPNGGTVLWNDSWSKLDLKVMEANRSAAIQTHLRNLSIGENDQRGKNIAFPGGGKWR